MLKPFASGLASTRLIEMPVQKFRSLEEASAAMRCEPRSEEHLRRLRFSYEFWSRVRPVTFPRGVRRYRSIEDADADFSRSD